MSNPENTETDGITDTPSKPEVFRTLHLERRRIVALLPDREIATVRAWLADHPQIAVVSRDRGRGYGEAVMHGSRTADLIVLLVAIITTIQMVAC